MKIAKALTIVILQVGVGIALPLPIVFVTGLSGVIVVALMAIVWVAFVIKELGKSSPIGLYCLRGINVLGAVVGVLLIGYGAFALDAAEKSARSGGGLLGAFGFVPMAFGAYLVVASLVTIGMLRRATGAGDSA